jgi:hypothetical protein
MTGSGILSTLIGRSPTAQKGGNIMASPGMHAMIMIGIDLLQDIGTPDCHIFDHG